MDVNPPRFVISVNNSDHFHFSYVRYIENRIRDLFGFEGTPIDIELRSRKSIYKDADRIADREEKDDSDMSEEKKEKREFDKKRKASKMAKKGKSRR